MTTATIDETTLSQTSRDMLNIARTSVATAESLRPKSDKRTEAKILLDLVLDGTDEDIKGLERFRDILKAKAAEVFTAEQADASGGMSDDDRRKAIADAKAAYTSATNVLAMPGFALPDGFVVPSFPGMRVSSSGTGAPIERPRNLKHDVTSATGDVVITDVTFAAVGIKIKASSQDLLAAFKAVAGDSKDDWEASDAGTWSWEYRTGESEDAVTYNVTTRYVG